MIPAITPSFTGTKVKILQEANKGKTYLFNEVLDIVRKDKIPATFHNKGVDFDIPSDAPNISNKLVSKLEEKGIKFQTVI